MIAVPSRRWLWGGAALAAIAPLAVWWPVSAVVLIAADLAWLAALVVDAALAPRVRDMEVSREAPAVFTLGRTATVRYRWRVRSRRQVALQVRERFPDPLGGADTPLRRMVVPPGAGLDEILEIRPIRRGTGQAGRHRRQGARSARSRLAADDVDDAMDRDGVPRTGRGIAPGAAAAGCAAARGGTPHRAAAGRGPALRGTA